MTRIFRNPSFKSLIMRSILVLTAALAAACSSWATPESTAQNPAIVSSPQSESWWLDRHNAVLAAVKAHPDTQLLMIGDSITNNYDKSMPPDQDFQPIWEQFYAPRKALNVGFSGDTTGRCCGVSITARLRGCIPRSRSFSSAPTTRAQPTRQRSKPRAASMPSSAILSRGCADSHFVTRPAPERHLRRQNGPR